jgi:hypothetical protein
MFRVVLGVKFLLKKLGREGKLDGARVSREAERVLEDGFFSRGGAETRMETRKEGCVCDFFTQREGDADGFGWMLVNGIMIIFIVE